MPTIRTCDRCDKQYQVEAWPDPAGSGTPYWPDEVWLLAAPVSQGEGATLRAVLFHLCSTCKPDAEQMVYSTIEHEILVAVGGPRMGKGMEYV